jgi:prepilin-type N-terminal cleavage/methylation domain-containing protein
MKSQTRQNGFTMIELLVTVMIIAMLVTAAAAGVVRARRTARDSQRMRDVFALGTALDQAASSTRGLYAYDTANKNTNVFCADLLGTATANPNNLNFGLFLSRAIPKDPLPERTSASCTNYRDGYTVSNRYGAGNNLARPSGVGNQNYEYVIEVGLEGDRPAEEKTLTVGTDNTSTVRKQFLLLGKACKADNGPVAGTCSLP